MNPADFFTNPNFGPFNSVISGPAKTLIAAAWAALLLFAFVMLMIGVGKLARARSNHRHEEMEREKSALMWPAIAIIGLLSMPAIVTAMNSFG